MFRRFCALATLLTVLLTAIGCSAKTGVLEGKATIGPTPAGLAGQPYPTEVYQPRKVMVYNADHSKLVKQVDLDNQGYYSVELPAGVTFTIDINYFASDYSNSAPRQLTLTPGTHVMFDIDFNTGAGITVIPNPGHYLFNSQNQSSEIMLKAVHVNKNFTDKQYMLPFSPPLTVNTGEFVCEVTGTIQNNHKQYKEIAMYAAGYDETGKQVAWTLDAAHIVGQIGLHIENGETGKFTLHLNTAEDMRTIQVFANIYSVTPP